MPPLKKIDYRDLIDKGAKSMPASQEQEQDKEQEEVSGIESLENRLASIDKKTKLELVMLFIVITAIAATFVFYLINKRPKYNPDDFYAPPAEQGL